MDQKSCLVRRPAVAQERGQIELANHLSLRLVGRSYPTGLADEQAGGTCYPL